MPGLCKLYPGICLTTEENALKNISQGSWSVLVGTMETDPVLHERYLHCTLPYSKFCKDDLMVVKWPKHVFKIKIKYIVEWTESKNCFVVLIFCFKVDGDKNLGSAGASNMLSVWITVRCMTDMLCSETFC
jgi:hypothetical protein